MNKIEVEDRHNISNMEKYNFGINENTSGNEQYNNSDIEMTKEFKEARDNFQKEFDEEFKKSMKEFENV